MQPTSDPVTSPSAAAIQEVSQADVTLDQLDERSLWRGATIVEDPSDAGVGTIDPERAEPAVPPTGQRYQIREVLGAGGMGEVRLCRDEAIGRDVAFKTMLGARESSERARHQFMREARVQGQLEHPSIVPVYDLGIGPGGSMFFTMRRVRGHTLREVIDALGRGAPDIVAAYSRRKLLEAFVRVCLAVDYAHARGVLHRDLKPSNIMLGDFGEVYVLDWGVATLVAEANASDEPVAVDAGLVRRGAVAGTPGYMSPEQLLGLDDRQDARTDVYALGAILFEILTLRRLHTGGSLEALGESTRLLVAAHPAALASDVPPELDAVCAKAASRDRASRFARSRELADAVGRYLDGDRDLERRRVLAVERAAAATAAFGRLAAPETDEGSAAIARADAVRELTAALAFDPENEEARHLLLRLFVEAPRRLPPEVESEMAAATRRDREQFVRFGSYAVAAWMFTFPVVVAMGVRAWPPVLLTTGLCVAAFFYARVLRRRADISFLPLAGLAALVLATIASVTCFLGPFVLVPQAIAVATLWSALACARPHERWVMVLLGVAAVAAPFLLEWFHVVPSAYAFTDGNLTLLARAVRLGPHTTLPMLFYSSITFVALPAIFLSGVRGALSAAERQLFLQAWHLRQLLPDAGRRGTGPSRVRERPRSQGR